MLAVRVSKDLESRLEALAKKSERSKSYYVKKALEQFLEEEEERQIALDAYNDYVKSGKRVHSFENVMKANELL